MNIGSDDLRVLYERLIRQQPYPGQTCPAEHVMVAQETRALPPGIRDLVGEHLVRCPSCREEMAELHEAMEWLDQMEDRVLLGLAAKGAAAGIQPWAKCPSSCVLFRYVGGEIRDTAGGKALRAYVRDHLGRCPDCARLAEEFRSSSAGPRLSILDLGARLGYAIADRFRVFLDALVAAAQAGGTPAMTRGAPGYRGPGDDAIRLDASVVDADGKLVVDEDGNPRERRFEIMKTAIQSDGFVTVDLVAVDEESRRARDLPWQATCALIAGGVRLDFPPAPIDDQGRVTFTGVLPGAEALDSLPLSALDVTVRPTPSPEGSEANE